MTLGTADWVGQVLADGRYEIAAELGRGGMAVVYRAHDRRLGCDVVLKVPQAALFQDPEFAGRFLREVRSLVQLAHPHIVRITDVGEHDGLPFAVMQFLSGGSLRERMEREGKVALSHWLEELGGWLQQIASALDFMHRRGFVHRDVKPDNILFDDEGHVYLSDFGIAKALRPDGARAQQTVLTGTGMVVGTAQYMAPEVILGEPYDGRADQYGLAVTVFELLSGRVPFEGTTPAAVAVQQQTKEAPSVDTLVPSVGRGVAEAVRRALARNPKERHPDCTTFAQSVLQAIGERPRHEQRQEQQSTETATAAAGAQGTVVQKAGVRCPHCGQKLRIPAKAQGKPVTCPKCRGRFCHAKRDPCTEPGRDEKQVSELTRECHESSNNEGDNPKQHRFLRSWKAVFSGAVALLCMVVLLCALKSGDQRTVTEPDNNARTKNQEPVAFSNHKDAETVSPQNSTSSQNRASSYPPSNRDVFPPVPSAVPPPSTSTNSTPANVVKGQDGTWEPAPGYKWLNDIPGDFRVVWSPGKAHSGFGNVIASENEGKWIPAPGYKWVNENSGDLRVVSAQQAATRTDLWNDSDFQTYRRRISNDADALGRMIIGTTHYSGTYSSTDAPRIQLSRDRSAIDVTITVNWRGGFTGDLYETAFSFSIDKRRGVGPVTVLRDTAVIPINPKYLPQVQEKLRAHYY